MANMPSTNNSTIQNFVNEPTQILQQPPLPKNASPQQKQQYSQLNKQQQQAIARQQKAKQQQASAQQKAQVAQQKQQAAAAARAAKTQAKIAQGVGGALVDSTDNVVSGVGETVATTTSGIASWVSSRPTPGGIMVLLLIIFLFLWMIVPVNGSLTRFQLMWNTLALQNTTIKGSKNVVDNSFQLAQPQTSQVSASLGNTPNTIADFSNGGGLPIL